MISIKIYLICHFDFKLKSEIEFRLSVIQQAKKLTFEQCKQEVEEIHKKVTQTYHDNSDLGIKDPEEYKRYKNKLSGRLLKQSTALLKLIDKAKKDA